MATHAAASRNGETLRQFTRMLRMDRYSPRLSASPAYQPHGERLSPVAARAGCHESEIDRKTRPVIPPHDIEIVGVGIGLRCIVAVQQGWLLVEQIVHTDVDTRVDGRDVVADRHVAVGGRTVMEHQRVVMCESWRRAESLRRIGRTQVEVAEVAQPPGSIPGTELPLHPTLCTYAGKETNLPAGERARRGQGRSDRTHQPYAVQ